VPPGWPHVPSDRGFAAGAALSGEHIEHGLRAVAEWDCTLAELEALKFHDAGVADRAIAAIWGISWSAAREHVHNAKGKLEEAERRREWREHMRELAEAEAEATARPPGSRAMPR
jgi:hypothetical protein